MLTKTFSGPFVFLVAFCCFFTTWALQCYNCDTCSNLASCKCDNTVTPSGEGDYCSLTREKVGTSFNYYVKATQRNSTMYMIYDPTYISVEEIIQYDMSSMKWSTISQRITYGCQTDRCNQADRLKELPTNGLSLSLPTVWLNDNLQRPSDANLTYCHHCPATELCSDVEYYIDIGKCNGKDCKTSCSVTDQFKEAESTEFCYQSFCNDDTGAGDSLSAPQVRINAIYYLKKKEFEILEIDLTCNAADCTDLQLFKSIKDRLEKNLANIAPFLPQDHSTTPKANGHLILPSLLVFLPILQFLFHL